ncbi:E3 ubiquitin-protein ligase RNF125 [Rhea pennata]|uniref:E3 ubiquitin-protein ligase RNF125 n=1 Tax=Rhea pennata TaxID=8795 RepID=UPI002E261AEA
MCSLLVAVTASSSKPVQLAGSAHPSFCPFLQLQAVTLTETLQIPTIWLDVVLFCHSCISTTLKNNAGTCPYCQVYLSSEGIPATDIAKKMKSIYRNCSECETQVCLSDIRVHLRTSEQYIKTYGPLQEPGDAVTKYSCPFCECKVDEDDLMDHCLTYHRSERRAVFCPICRLTPERDPSYCSRKFIRHLQLRHTFYYEDYIVNINAVEEVLVEKVLDRSFLGYMNVNYPNSM